MSEADIRIGKVLHETYRVARLLGQGGMGAVYEATHVRVPKRFAVKFLDPMLSRDRETFERFQREAEIASSIGHEHIVEAFDFNHDDDGSPYMVLELLNGEDLSQRIARGPLSVSQTARIIDEVADAVDAAHKQGIIHRDLKPQNIFLCRRGARTDFVKVLDFGISKILNAGTGSTRTGQILGTANYMAPEQAMGRLSDISVRSDVFAVAAIAYECLTGTLAFDGDSAMSILYQVCNAEVPSVSSLVPGVPQAIDAVLRIALAKKASERFATMEEFRSAFLSACGGVRPTASSLVVDEDGVTTRQSAEEASNLRSGTNLGPSAVAPVSAVVSSAQSMSTGTSVATLDTSLSEPTMLAGSRSRAPLVVAAVVVAGAFATVIFLLSGSSTTDAPAAGVTASAPVTVLYSASAAASASAMDINALPSVSATTAATGTASPGVRATPGSPASTTKKPVTAGDPPKVEPPKTPLDAPKGPKGPRETGL